MTRMPRVLWVALTAALLLAPLWAPGERDAAGEPPRSLRARLLAPIAPLLGQLQWIRVEGARRRGRHDLVFVHGARALEWDPSATAGWELLAHHQGLLLASTLREPDPARRADWLRAGLETARRGEARATRPGRLALLAGLMLQVHAERDAESAWPGGVAGLWRDALVAYERAAAWGEPEAEILAAGAHERLHELRGGDAGSVR